ncbi:MAG TPA: DUF742 domain-containing protein [Streptosporangiaceae bacterium]|nr:DUF742 domain-containing protein [Streptosporangiaceae bacterium]
MNDSRREQWLDEAAGPIVRPYAVTRGRTRPRGEKLDLVTILVTTGRSASDRLAPEQRRLLTLCRRPRTLADLASELDLPLGVVQVLLGDLHHNGLVEVRVPDLPAEQPDRRLLMRVLNDLRAL